MNKLAFAAAIVAMSAAPAFAKDKMHSDKMHSDMMADDKFAEADTDHDGMISMEEHEACAKRMFDKADTNGDKMISKDEMRAYMHNEMKMKHKTEGAPVSNDTKTNKSKK
jgi:Ca2+-binding EF-hand superfamily protein